jgi:serine protease Do
VAEAFVGVIVPEDDADDAWLLDVMKDTPASKAGLKPGDTITKLGFGSGGKAIKSVKEYRTFIKQRVTGDVVKFTVRRGTELLVLPVTLGRKGRLGEKED